MRACKSIFLIFIVTFFTACDSDNNGDKLKGSMRFSTVTTGPIDASHQYLFTFSGLVGDLEIPNGILLGPNSDTTVSFNRVGEQLSIFMMDVPTTCGDITSKSSTTSQLGFNDDPAEPGAVYESLFLVPLNGSTGEIEFTVSCN